MVDKPLKRAQPRSLSLLLSLLACRWMTHGAFEIQVARFAGLALGLQSAEAWDLCTLDQLIVSNSSPGADRNVVKNLRWPSR